MSIRRVSDLPELTSTYHDAFPMDDPTTIANSANRCCIEVSYSNTDGIYQSFYTKLSTLSAILNSGVDTSKYVLTDTAQTISGKKTFSNAGGITVGSGSAQGTMKGVTDDQSGIANATAGSSIVPTSKAVKDYVKTYVDDQGFLKTIGFEDPTELVNKINGLLNDKDIVIYVDPAHGKSISQVVIDKINDSNKGLFLKNADGSHSDKMVPVSSIYDAIEIAKQVKFLENANCHIRILNDLTLETGSSFTDGYRQVVFAHPDLVQNKYFSIYGYASSSYSNGYIANLGGSYAVRRISIDLTKGETTKNKHYKIIISCIAQVYFSYLVFDGKLRLTHFKNGNSFSLKSDLDFGTYLIRNTGSSTLRLDYCAVIGAPCGVVGPSLEISRCAFAFCHVPIEALAGSGRSNISGLNILYCYFGVNSYLNAIAYTSPGMNDNRLRICTVIPTYYNTDNSSTVIGLHTLLNDSALVADPSGTITIDGQKYRRATSTDMSDNNTTTLVVNHNMAGLEIYKITGFSDSLPTTSRIKMTGTTDAKWNEFKNQFASSNDDRSYINIDPAKGSNKWVYALTEQGVPDWTATSSEITIPGISTAVTM